MIKHFGKKVHIWPRNRHDSINENEIANNRQNSINSNNLPDFQEPQDNFRSRSKSLDVQSSRKILDDCESTYKIYNRILKEGKNLKNLVLGYGRTMGCL
jgi:5'-AMP-activated protein kinase regulatory gamma subunit